MNKRHHIITLLITTILLIGLSACGAKRSVVHQKGEFGEFSKREFIDRYTALQTYPLLDARGALTLWTEGRKENINISGVGMRWTLERDRAFELSVRPMSFMEVGKLTIRDNRVLVLDRMNKVAFLEEDALRTLRTLITTVGVDPLILKAVVQNDPFGFVSSGVGVLERMRYKRESQVYTFTDQLRPGGNKIVHTFDASLNLISSSIHIADKADVLISNYEFIQVGGVEGRRALPTRIQMEVKTLGKQPQHFLLHFGLQRVTEKASTDFSTDLPNGYKRIGLTDLIDILSSL